MATQRFEIRRGLPRTPGGQPWPPSTVMPSGPPTEMPLHTPPPGGLQGASAPTAEVDPPTVGLDSPTPAPRRSEAGQSRSHVIAVRRGLPRIAGGEPWPSAVPVAPPVEVPDRPAPEAATPSVTVRRGLSRVPGGAPWPPWESAPAQREVVPRPISEPEEAAAPVAVREPAAATMLHFTPTAWPGVSAGAYARRRDASLPRPDRRRGGPFTPAQWAGVVVVAGIGLVYSAAMVVLAVRWLLSTTWGSEFLAAFPGEYHLPEGAPVGFPPWLGWQHFFNAFLIVLIIRSGLQVRREQKPAAYWSPRWNRGRKISLRLWFHQSLDALWVLNGVVFLVLLFVSGQWMRIVPTSWEVFPHAFSAALQYASLDWPTDNGWVNYNSLQQLAYFTTVLVAAPLAVITGVRMSGLWPTKAVRLSRAYPVEWARAVHFPVMIYFVAFIIVHVVLVFATGALRNLNHMYAAQDAVNWTGFWIFVAATAVMLAALVAARPLVLAPIARLFGTVSGR